MIPVFRKEFSLTVVHVSRIGLCIGEKDNEGLPFVLRSSHKWSGQSFDLHQVSCNISRLIYITIIWKQLPFGEKELPVNVIADILLLRRLYI